jgi:hypothetical protein
MSEPFRPYEKLVEITLLDKKFQVPERNSLLRCFQFISPETIPYGRFCWKQVHRDAGYGSYRAQPGTEVVPALEAAAGRNCSAALTFCLKKLPAMAAWLAAVKGLKFRDNLSPALIQSEKSSVLNISVTETENF